MAEFTVRESLEGRLTVKIEGKGIELISLLRDAACEEPFLREIYRLAADDAEFMMSAEEAGREPSFQS